MRSSAGWAIDVEVIEDKIKASAGSCQFSALTLERRAHKAFIGGGGRLRGIV